MGGIKAVTWTEVQQMVVIFVGLFAALITAVNIPLASRWKTITALPVD